MLVLSLIVILSYLVGSIPNSIIVGKAVKGIDIRNFGSGNAGGTNVGRVLGWKYGILVILLDALKGIVAVVFVTRLFYLDNMPFSNPTPFDDFTLVQIIAGLAAVLGHIWTIFANFKGGKGIATALGMLLIISTVDILVAFGVFVIVVALSKYISLGSISAAVAVPITLYLREHLFNANISNYYTLFPFVVALSLLVIFTHRKNISKLLKGRENKISFSKKK
ncbi:MAG: glycerol-3-phosphate 1-O-acyltransferase PlsY [Ignavibacterium sp.]